MTPEERIEKTLDLIEEIRREARRAAYEDSARIAETANVIIGITAPTELRQRIAAAIRECLKPPSEREAKLDALVEKIRRS